MGITAPESADNGSYSKCTRGIAMNKTLRITSKLSKFYRNLPSRSRSGNSMISRMAIAMAALVIMTISLSGCSPMQVSERTLLLQLGEPKESELPIISEVYPPSIKSDVYNPEKDQEDLILP
jgi:hypothetical protein